MPIYQCILTACTWHSDHDCMKFKWQAGVPAACGKPTALLCSMPCMFRHLVELIYVRDVKANVRKLSANGVTVTQNKKCINDSKKKHST